MDRSQLMKLPLEELRKQAKLDFQLFPDNASLLNHFARSVADQIKAQNAKGEPTRLILPVGPTRQYPTLIEISNREKISWKNVYTFNMDEFLDWQGRPLPLDHPFSFEGFMKREVVAKLDPQIRMPEENCYVPHPFRIDESSEKIREVGGIDCCYGGVGYHGHVAFNEPPISRWYKVPEEQFRESATRVLTVADDSIVVQSIGTAGADCEAIPPMAVTLGMKDLYASRKIRLYCAAGARQRAVFRIAVGGDVTTEYPVTLIQGHPDARVHTEETTAAPIEYTLF